MKQNHPSNHKDTEEDYFSEKEDVDENSDDDGNKNDEKAENTITIQNNDPKKPINRSLSCMNDIQIVKPDGQSD